jgi:hypothetical protein
MPRRAGIEQFVYCARGLWKGSTDFVVFESGILIMWYFVTPVFPKKTKCKPICMLGSIFMHIVDISE